MANIATSQESSARALKANAEPIATTPTSINPDDYWLSHLPHLFSFYKAGIRQIFASYSWQGSLAGEAPLLLYSSGASTRI